MLCFTWFHSTESSTTPTGPCSLLITRRTYHLRFFCQLRDILPVTLIMADTLTAGPPSPFLRRDSKLLTPPRSPRRPPLSPQPSSSLLKLQKLGLELGPSQSRLSLHAPSYNSSIRTTPSDLDKPLPLEPPEIDRRASSVYSVETTISNILDMYGGVLDGDLEQEESRVPNAHRSQAYRDTVAPLMARRYSGAESPPPLPLFFKGIGDTSSPISITSAQDYQQMIFPPMPSPSIYQDFSPPLSPDVSEMPALPMPALAPSPSIYPESPPLSPADSKHDAPSFSEFARSLPQKRHEVVSPLSSASSEDYHRQIAMDSLAPPSPQDSPNVHPIAVEGSDLYLPGPMSGTITQIVAPDMIPPPLDISHASRSFSQESIQKPEKKESRNSFEDFLAQSGQKASSLQSSLDRFNNSPVPPPAESHHELPFQRYTEQEQHRILSYASEKYPGMNSPSRARRTRTSKGSSLSQRAGSIMRALSTRKSSTETGGTAPSRRSGDTAERVDSYIPGGRKKLAVQPTSYQLYGEAAWDKEDNGKRNKRGGGNRKEQRSSKGSNRSQEDGHDADGQKVGFLEGARRKLTRTASEKRREKLKNSIKLVGPTEITKERHAREDPRRWWE